MKMVDLVVLLRKAFFVLLFLGMLPLLSSCGYQLGNMMHPQIKTVAIADVKNESMAF